MGTRNMTFAVLDGEYKIAKYCQWDGYPDGQGVTALRFVSHLMRRTAFEQKLRSIRYLTDEEIQARWKECGADNSGWVTMEVADRMKVKSPQLSRDMGADVLLYVQETPDVELDKPDIRFAADSLFCEWAYVIDLDRNSFEVYRGFNHDKLEPHERFYSLSPPEHKSVEGPPYQPIRLEQMWSFNRLPDQEEFLAELNKEEEAA